MLRNSAPPRDDLGRIEIKSPAAGQVVGLAFQTVGWRDRAGTKADGHRAEQPDVVAGSARGAPLKEKIRFHLNARRTR